MRKRIFGSLAALLSGAGTVLAQTPVEPQSLPTTAEPVLAGQPPGQPAGQPSETPVISAPVVSDMAPVASAPANNRLWFQADYLMWWVKSAPAPTMVTSAPGNSAAAIPGLLGNADTTVELGGSPISSGIHSGARFALGCWLDSDQRIGVEANYFFLARRSINQTVSSGGEPNSRIVGYSFANPLLAPAGEDFAATGSPLIPAAGTNTLTTSSQLNSAEVSGALNLMNSSGFRLDVLAGARYTQLDEGLRLTGNTLGLPGSIFPGASIGLEDQFFTYNRFWGGQLGARGEYRCGNLIVNATAKVALGDMHETVNINGFTTVSGPFVVPAGTYPGGIFAQSSNIGHYSHDRFGVIPEANINLGYQVTSWARFQVGYSFLYLSSVARPGDQVDRTVNLSQAPAAGGSAATLVGPANPAFNFHDSGMWAQGINFGLEFRY